MDFLKQSLEIIKLNKEEVFKVSQDESATKNGILILLAIGVLEVILDYIIKGSISFFGFLSPLFGIYILALLVNWGTTIFKGEKRSASELFRPFSYAYIFYLPFMILSFILSLVITPSLMLESMVAMGVLLVVGLGVLIWGLVINIVIIKAVYNLSTMRAIGAFILPSIIILILLMVLAAIFGFAIMNVLGPAPA